MGDPEKQEPPPEYNAQSTTTQQSAGTVTLNVSYMVPRGILKILEIFFLMIAFACAADWCSNCAGLTGRYNFFMFATIFPWLICIIIFILYLFCLVDKIPQLNWNMTVLINSILWAVILLIAASLWGDTANDFRGGILYASVIFAFFAIITFVVDIIVLFRKWRG